MKQTEEVKMSTRLRVDAEEFIEALQNHGGEPEFFLNLETGEVEMRFDEAFKDDDDEEGDEDAESTSFEDATKYRPIYGVSSSRSFRVMEDFLETLPSGPAKASLTNALTQRKPFRRFKDVLLDYEKIREDWFRFEFFAFLVLAQEWLDEEQVDAELVIPPRLLS